MGHVPIAYLVSRSMHPSGAAEPDVLQAVKAIVTDLLVFGFNWRLPRSVLELPKLGVLNVHPSALPKYRGPSPVLWAIRNGDQFMGVTVHRMTERVDAGPILAQVDDVPIPDKVTSQDIWDLTKTVLPGLLAQALDYAVRGEPGIPQHEANATRAGFPPPEWYEVTWQGSRRSLHNQIRVLRYLNHGQAPIVQFQGQMTRVHRTSQTADGGIRIECADGPLWVTSEPCDLG